MRYLLGMDIGTTNQKVLMTTLSGEKVASATRENRLIQPGPGMAEQDPEQWWSNTISLLQELSDIVGHEALRQIGGICISSQTVTLLPVDAQGNALMNALIWMDGRSGEELREVLETVGRENYIRIAGGQPDVVFLPGKLRWLVKNRPEVLKKTKWLLQANGYVNLKLTRKASLDLDQAVRTQCYDIVSGCWSDTIGRAVGADLNSLLPNPSPVTQIIGHVTQEAAAVTGLAADTPVVAGCCDAMASLYAIGLKEPGQAGESSGTSSLVFALTENPSATDIPVVARPCSIPGAPYVFDAPINATGGAIRWFLDNLAGQRLQQAKQAGENVYDLLNKMAAESPAGSRGLLFLPYLHGERAPLWDTAARGMFVGLTTDTTQEDVARAVFEGTAFALRHVVQTIRQTGTPISSLRLTGGGAKSLEWAQIKADVLQIPVELMTDAAGDVPLGDVIIAGQALGLDGTFEKILEPSRILKPNPENREIYDKMYRLYRSVYDKLIPEQRELEALHQQKAIR